MNTSTSQQTLIQSMSKGACELDDLVFKNGQEALSRELESFVEEFEVNILTWIASSFMR
jgi:hypothetical protein